MFPLQSSIPLRTTPLVTWVLIGLNALFFLLYSGLDPDQIQILFHHLGLVPARYTHPEWARQVGLLPYDFSPFLTSMFLHGGVMHLVGNMWTLWIFGPNVEERMGRVRFVLFYLLTGIAAAGVHVWTNGNSTLPTVGASGAIAGVMGAYLTLFPRARILFMIPIFFYPFLFVWPAALYLVYWFGLQFFSGAFSLLAAGQVGGVAWWAHVGGFLSGAGLCRFLLCRPRQWNPPDDYPSYLYRGL